MAKKGEAHHPSCPWRRPSMKVPKGKKKPKQHAAHARWSGLNLSRGYLPTGFQDTRRMGGFKTAGTAKKGAA